MSIVDQIVRGRLLVNSNIFHGRTKSCLGLNVLYCTHCLQLSMDDIVNKRMPVKNVSAQSIATKKYGRCVKYENAFLLETIDCFCRVVQMAPYTLL